MDRILLPAMLILSVACSTGKESRNESNPASNTPEASPASDQAATPEVPADLPQVDFKYSLAQTVHDLPTCWTFNDGAIYYVWGEQKFYVCFVADPGRPGRAPTRIGTWVVKDLTGPQGEKGDQGDAGEKGDPGAGASLGQQLVLDATQAVVGMLKGLAESLVLKLETDYYTLLEKVGEQYVVKKSDLYYGTPDCSGDAKLTFSGFEPWRLHYSNREMAPLVATSTVGKALLPASIWRGTQSTCHQLEGVSLQKEFFPGESGGYPVNFTTVAGKVYFGALVPNFGWALWQLDATGGTSMVFDPATTPFRDVSSLVALHGVLYFQAYDKALSQSSLWRYSGSGLPERMDAIIGQTFTQVSALQAGPGAIYFNAITAAGHRNWRFDGTTATSISRTIIIKDTQANVDRSAGIDYASWLPDGRVVLGAYYGESFSGQLAEYVYFSWDGQSPPIPLWNPNAGQVRSAGSLRKFSGGILFSAKHPTTNLSTVWMHDGMTARVLDDAAATAADSPTSLHGQVAEVGGELFLRAYSKLDGRIALWRYSSSRGVQRVFSPSFNMASDVVAFDGAAYMFLQDAATSAFSIARVAGDQITTAPVGNTFNSVSFNAVGSVLLGVAREPLTSRNLMVRIMPDLTIKVIASDFYIGNAAIQIAQGYVLIQGTFESQHLGTELYRYQVGDAPEDRVGNMVLPADGYSDVKSRSEALHLDLGQNTLHVAP